MISLLTTIKHCLNNHFSFFKMAYHTFVVFQLYAYTDRFKYASIF